MKLNIIKHQNGTEGMNLTLNLTTSDEIMSVINKITTFADRKKIDILSKGFSYDEIKVGDIKGFISPTFQVLTSGNYIDITEEETHYQFYFISSIGIMSLPILAA